MKSPACRSYRASVNDFNRTLFLSLLHSYMQKRKILYVFALNNQGLFAASFALWAVRSAFASVEGVEPTTSGFGDRRSTN